MDQLPQLIGAAMLLLAFAASQLGRLKNGSLSYLLLNGIGALLLTIDAIRAVQLGFIALEGTWCLISAVSLLKLLRTR